MTAAEQAATPHPERARWHRFTVLGVYDDGRGIEPVTVDAVGLDQACRVIERSGARLVTRYDGYFPPTSKRARGTHR